MHDLLIIGGGYGGLWAAMSAARQLNTLHAHARVAIVSREPFLTARPRLYEQGLAATDARIDRRPVLQTLAVEYIEGDVSEVIAAQPGVRLADGTQLSCRALILATGSQARRAPLPGMAEFAADADTAAAATLQTLKVRATP